MRASIEKTFLATLLGAALALPSAAAFGATPTWTQTWTPTSTPSPTPTSTPTFNPLASNSPTLTPTRSMTFTGSPTPSPSPTQSPSPTRTQTPVPGAFSGTVVDDFEDGNLQTTNGGGIITLVDILGSTCSTTIIPGGCSFGSSAEACHLSGSLVQDTGNTPYAKAQLQLLPGGMQVNLSGIPSCHCLTFSYMNLSPGTAYRICLDSAAVSDGDNYCFSFTPASAGWQRQTVYFPDVAGAGLPKLAQAGTGLAVSWTACLASATALCFEPLPSSAAPISFDLKIDDLNFSAPPSVNNPQAVAAALGAPLGTVTEGYGLETDEFMAWVIIRLSIHCGCTPHFIYGLRSTMSWGEICALYGTSWAAILSETESMATAGGLACPESRLDQLQRSLDNNPPLTPQTTPLPYVPGGPLTVPPALGGCQ